MTARKNLIDALEEKVEKVEHLKPELQAAETDVETTRSRVWKLLGGEPFGAVRFGMFRFSKLMLIIGAAFMGLIAGALMSSPIMAVMLAACVAGCGILWVRSKLS